jgi:hypothetical protein
MLLIVTQTAYLLTDAALHEHVHVTKWHTSRKQTEPGP